MPVRGTKQRALLALLALHRGSPVAADRLIDALWEDGQSANPANALQAQIGQLRRTLGAAAIVTTEAGYALAVDPDDMDAVRFEQLVAEGRRLLEEGDVEPASATLGEALELRRGEPLGEFAYAGFADAERAHLDELTLVAFEANAEADLALGRHGEVIGQLEALCREHPLRERLWELLILALYRDGRQAEALRAYTEIRDRLVDELGIDPGAALRELEARVLAQDPTLAADRSSPASATAGALDDGRKPAGAAEQLRRPRSAELEQLERDGAHLPARDTGRPRWGRQDQTGGGGGRLPPRRAPRRRLAGRAGQRHRARRSWRRPWPVRSGPPRPRWEAPIRRDQRSSSSCTIWPGDPSSSSSTTVST